MPPWVFSTSSVKRYLFSQNPYNIIRSRLETFIILWLLPGNPQKQYWIDKLAIIVESPRDFQYSMMSTRKYQQVLIDYASRFFIFLDKNQKILVSIFRSCLETFNIPWCLWENTQQVLLDQVSKVVIYHWVLFYLCVVVIWKKNVNFK